VKEVARDREFGNNCCLSTPSQTQTYTHAQSWASLFSFSGTPYQPASQPDLSTVISTHWARRRRTSLNRSYLIKLRFSAAMGMY